MNSRNTKKPKRSQSLKKPRKIVQDELTTTSSKSTNKRSSELEGSLLTLGSTQSTESPPSTPALDSSSVSQIVQIPSKDSISTPEEIPNEEKSKEKKSGAIHAEDDVMAQLEDVLAKQLKKGKGKRRGLPDKQEASQESSQVEEAVKPKAEIIKEEEKKSEEKEPSAAKPETKSSSNTNRSQPVFTFMGQGGKTKKYSDKQERLLRQAVCAFVYMTKRKTLVWQRWRKWKYTMGPGEQENVFDEDYEPEWMRNDTQNYAIGRRIYDKNEIENENNVRDKLTGSNQPRKIDIKNAAEIFGLWDNVYGKDAIKALENAQRWDPARINREKKLNQKKSTLSLVDPTLPLEELAEKEDEQQVGYQGPTSEEIDEFLKETNFNTVAIRNWHKAFYTECPNGQLTKEHMQKMFLNLFPTGDCMPFCNAIFRIFSNRHNAEFLEFKEFLKAINVTTIKSEDERLRWAFRLYDADNSGSLNFDEMSAVIRMLEDFEGSKQKDSETDTERVSQLFQSLVRKDSDGNGTVSMEEFVEGYMRLKARMEALKNNNTVVLSMTISDKKARDRAGMGKLNRSKEKASKS